MRKYLKQLREEKELTQQCVADSLGITRQYYNLIETGQRQIKMSVALAQKLANVFNVPIEYILENETR